MLKYTGYYITFQEIPNEVTLTFTLSSCGQHCAGCHSPWLQEDEGRFLAQDLQLIIDDYSRDITCVLFMGQGGDEKELIEHLRNCSILRPYLKLALYTGKNEISPEVDQYLTYKKIGPYIQSRGGLAKLTTNQKFFEKEDGEWVQHNERFWNANYLSEWVYEINPDKEFYKMINEKIDAKGGHCPCQLPINDDTLCMCKDFITQKEEGWCHCKKYRKFKREA